MDTHKNTPLTSFAVPGRLLKRTSAKEPATARPAPMLPFTIMITSVTMEGSTARLMAREAECRVKRVKSRELSTPRIIAHRMHIMKLLGAMAAPRTLLNKFHHSTEIIFHEPLLIASAVF